MRRTVDVVVVGGGPAGSATAILLARAGLRVCLLEKGRYPREKPCGEYLSPGCLPLLARLGALPAIEAHGPQPIRGMRIESSGGTVLTGRYPGNGTAPHGYALPRCRLDPVLFEVAREAGVDCREGWRVVDLLSRGAAVAGVVAESGRSREALPAAVTIGADGRQSVIARRLGVFTWHPSHRKMALVQRFHGPVDRGDLGEVCLGRAGYCILNPQGRGVVNVGLVLDQHDLPLHRPWEAVFRHVLGTYPAAQAKLEDAHPVNALRVLGPLACRSTCVAGDGFLLVGDAAGYYDPMTGEGVHQALRGAELAAASVIGALSGSKPLRDSLHRYALAYREEFTPKDRVCQLLQHVVRHPRLREAVGGWLKRHPEQLEQLLGVVGDLLPPGRLLRPDFWLRFLLCQPIDGPPRTT